MEVVWDTSFSVGVETFDNHHKKLFAIINELYAIYADDSKRPRVKELTFQLLDYTYFHFGAEERAMKDAEFPEITNHLVSHQEFKKNAARFFSKVTRLTADEIKDNLNFLTRWLSEHIGQMDKEYSSYFTREGVAVYR
jgi:hemerythrin-like metal-binding protein